MAVRREVKIIFDRLLERLLEGMVVPFIGAGVSSEAEYEVGIKDLTKTCKMTDRIREALIEKCRDRNECGPCIVKNELCRENDKDNKKISFDKVCELWEWSCSEDHQARRCELIYDILKIPEFTKLKPTDAHYYISFLAREELIDEIITTNYDTCMEKAYRNTFGSKYQLLEKDSPDLVIDDLSEYRGKAGRRFTEGQTPQHCLKIYKINGCAGRLPEKQKHDENGCCKCKDILLTERDLQSWRHRGWARDLFRDRMRSRTLLFSGFGSDEPQVRFTVMQVCEEFTLQKQEGIQSCTDNNGYIWTKPNAPFIVGYGNNLTFSQTQILHAFAQSSNVSISLKDLNSNSFLDSDIEFFNSKDDSSKQIKADLFWKRLFQAAFWRLLRRECIRDGAVASFFTRTLPCANTLMIEVLNWFAPENDPNFVFGRFPEMLDLEKDEGRVVPLMRWVERVRGVQTEVREGLYIPVGEDSALIMIILIIIYLLLLKDGSYKPESDIAWSLLNNTIKNKDENPPLGSYLGLYLDTSNISNSANTGFHIIHKNAASCLPKIVKCNENSKNSTAIQIVVGDWQASTRRVWIVNEKTGDVKIVTVRQISFLQLLGEAHNVKEAKKAFRDNLKSTFLLTDEGRRRVRFRTEPL